MLVYALTVMRLSAVANTDVTDVERTWKFHSLVPPDVATVTVASSS